MYDGPKTFSFANRFQYRFDDHAVLHSTWKNHIAFAHGYKGEKLPDLLTYQKEHFLSTTLQREALIQFYTLPSPHNHAWYYSWVDLPGLSFIRNRAVYQEHVYPNRIQTMLSNMRQHKPALVLMYGMNNINGIKKSVQEFFQDVAFKQIKGIKQQFPQHHRADFHGTTLLITTQMPNLRHGRIETGFDWEAFGRSVAGQLRQIAYFLIDDRNRNLRKLLKDRSFRLSIILTIIFFGTGILFLFLGIVE